VLLGPFSTHALLTAHAHIRTDAYRAALHCLHYCYTHTLVSGGTECLSRPGVIALSQSRPYPSIFCSILIFLSSSPLACRHPIKLERPCECTGLGISVRPSVRGGGLILLLSFSNSYSTLSTALRSVSVSGRVGAQTPQGARVTSRFFLAHT